MPAWVERINRRRYAPAADSNTYTKLVDDAYPFRNMFNNRLFRERYRQRLRNC